MKIEERIEVKKEKQKRRRRNWSSLDANIAKEMYIYLRYLKRHLWFKISTLQVQKIYKSWYWRICEILTILTNLIRNKIFFERCKLSQISGKEESEKCRPCTHISCFILWKKGSKKTAAHPELKFGGVWKF